MKFIPTIAFCCFLLTNSICTLGQDAAELAKKLANPISSLISVPLQNNTDYGIGENNGTKNVLNIQPVIPVRLNEKLNLITRVIAPVITQYNIIKPGTKQSGLGDFIVSEFISPAEAKNGITWGAGPVLLLPVGTDDYLTTKKFGVGPTVVFLKQSNGFTFGALMNQIWSVAGDEDRSDISSFFYQPFLTYNWKSGAGVSVNFEGTEDWENNTSVGFVNLGISAVTALGKQKVSMNIGPRFNVMSPEGSKADWGWRAVLALLLPKG